MNTMIRLDGDGMVVEHPGEEYEGEYYVMTDADRWPDDSDGLTLLDEQVRSLPSPLPESPMRLVSEETPRYVHADILEPGPNISKRPDDGIGCFRAATLLIALEFAVGLLWLIVWASRRWNF